MTRLAPLLRAAPAPVAPASLRAALAAASEHLAALRTCYAALASDPDPGGPIEARLRAHLAERDDVVRALGEAMLASVTRGDAAPELIATVGGESMGVEPAGAERVVARPVAPEAVATIAPERVPSERVATIAPEAVATIAPEPVDAGERSGALEASGAGEPANVFATRALGEGAAALRLEASPQPAQPASSTEAGGPPAPGPAALPADQSALRGLVLGPTWARGSAAAPPRPPPAREVDLEGLARRLRDAYGARLDDGAAIARCAALADALHDAVDAPGPVLHALIGAWVGLARDLQDRVPPSTRLTAAFRTVLDLSAATRPGTVNGLGRNHRPARTWLEEGRAAADLAVFRVDARDATTPERALPLLERLVDAPDDVVRQAAAHARAVGVHEDDPRLLRAVASRAAAFAVGKQWSGLRRALRAHARDRDRCPSPDEPDADLPADWPHARVTAGARIALVGGDLREERRTRLAAAFRLGELDWVSGLQPRQVQALQDRVRAGSIDMVWVLAAFCSHKVSVAVGATCRGRDVPLVVVRKGTGVQNVRLALEQHLGAHAR